MKTFKLTSRMLAAFCTALLLFSLIKSGQDLTQVTCRNGTSILTSSLPEKAVESSFEECTAVIVTGTAAKEGRAILMKNRDTSDSMNKPIYVPNQTIIVGNQTFDTYAFITINQYWMGINEKGLAVMNTLMSSLAGIGHGFAWNNGQLNQKILELCENVSQVAKMLNDTESIIGPNNRACATCIGVVDRYGNGAFFEISPTEAYCQYVIDGYDSRANHPRIFPGKASGPNGRDQYALDVLNEIYAEKGEISWEDLAQKVSRYVRHMELGDSCFSISAEVCNDATQSAMVAVSGNPQYDGKLNCMWGEYGNPPIVGLFVPSMVYAGSPPPILNNFWNYVWEKRNYAQSTCGSYHYNATRVREIQTYTFFAEDYTFQKYEDFIATIPDGLSDSQLRENLQNFVNDAVQVATNIYIQEPKVLDHTVLTEYCVTTVSNSTVTDFNFSQAQKTISFNLTGPLESSSFCYVTIPTELLNGVFTIIVGEDTHVIEEVLTWHQNSSLLNFTCIGSVQVKIIGTMVISEFGEYGETSLLHMMILCVFVACFLYAIKRLQSSQLTTIILS